MVKKRTKGFTLIELMIVVAIIGILAAIAIPKFANLVAKAKEGKTKGNLAAIRSGVSIFYADNDGKFPIDNLASLIPIYIKDIPEALCPTTACPDSSTVTNGDAASGTGSTLVPAVAFFISAGNIGGWAYSSDSADAEWGTTVVNCLEQDTKGIEWYKH